MRYDYGGDLLQNTLERLGEERFSKMRATEIERVVRQEDKTTPLQSRSQFRAAIRQFRVR